MKNLKNLSALTLFGFGIAFASNAYAESTLWNINFAGRTSSNVTVADGLVLNAGSIGSNNWNNIVAPTLVWDPAAPISITDSNGANAIDFDVVSSTTFANFSADNGVVGAGTQTDLNKAFFGLGNFDSTLEFSGLDTGATYDIYVYFTWKYNENDVNYTITKGSGATTALTLTPNQSSSTNYNDYIDGTDGTAGNYVVFHNISSDQFGAIDLRATSADGGFNAIQLVQIPEPSTYALLFGAMTLTGALLIRRRRQ